MAWNIEELKAAHGHCIRNREEIGRSTSCGCFHCYVVFRPAEIVDWAVDRVEEGPLDCSDWKEVTATCPRCSHDTVLGDACGYPVTDPAFLRAMHNHWL